MHIYILGPKLLQWNFFPNRSIFYTKWCAQTFPPIFELSAIFDHSFANIVAPSSDENENCMALLKGISLLKMLKAPSKLIHKPRHNDRLNYAPCRTHSPPDRSVTEKKTNTMHIFAPTAGARCSISPKLCMVVELIAPILNVVNHFSIQFIVFLLGGKILIFGY